jgi:hypothetical protein
MIVTYSYINYQAELSEKQYWVMRETIIYAMLGTDIENHFQTIGNPII